ncbi:fimbrial protein [Pseudomonas marginalis]|uniref:fimbrial protein n=1 Tax=Pseudomonas marginalis TaxID=298 RepID=UPI003B9F6E9F
MNAKKMASLGLACTAAILFQSAHAVDASDGTINFTGMMIEQTCSVSINGQAGASPTITLPTVTTQGLNGEGTQGATKGDTLLKFVLTGCTGAATKARVFFENAGSATVYQGGAYPFNLKNTSSDSDAAAGVALQLYDVTGTPIRVGDAAQRNLPAVTLGGEMVYGVRYLSITVAATPGPFTASATYSLDYL